MPTHPFDFEIQADLFSTPELTAIFDEKQRFARWLRFEAALAATQAELGIIPAAAAAEIAARATLEQLDPELLRAGYRQSRNSLVPLLKALRQACRDGHGEYVHYGATTQDVIDTGQILELRELFAIFYRDLRLLEKRLLDLAERHRATPMVGRTHGQQALPITFGLKCAVWLAEIRRHLERLKNLHPRLMTGQLSGAVGTFAALGPRGREVARGTLARLKLAATPLSWHTSRDNLAEAAGFMALLSTTLEKIANEIFLLGKTEIGELREGAPAGKAGSSTMPHKRNPVLCQRVAVLARQVRALSGTVVESMLHEHERDARALWSEWLALPQISVYTGTALNYINQIFNGLEIDAGRMLTNLRQQGGLVVSEWLLFRLAPVIGKMRAQEIMARIIDQAQESGLPLADILRATSETAAILQDDDYELIGHPEKYLGLAADVMEEFLVDLKRQRDLDPEEF